MKKLRKFIFIILFLNITFCFSQIIKNEEVFYNIEFKDKNYSTYHFVESQFSQRSFQVFVVNDSIFQEVITQVPRIKSQNPKQDYTDFYVLGISNLDINLLVNIDKEILSIYVNKINEYRRFNNLSTVENKEFLDKHIIHFLKDKNDLCLYMQCAN